MLDFRTLVLAGTAFVTSLSPLWSGETPLGPEANPGFAQVRPGPETAATTFGICCDPGTGGCFNAPQPACPPPYQFIAGAACGQGPCGSQPVGACCNPDTGACEVVFTPSACSGVFYSGKLCAQIQCPPNALGACCDPGVGCFEAPASQCPLPFAFYIGQFCANVSCGGPLTGACCDPSSGFCFESTQPACNYNFHPNQTCSSISCGVSFGACCDPNTGSCFETTPANCPFNFYPGQTCLGIVCEPTGACCDTLSGFCVETPASQCFHTFYPGLTCSQITCVGDVFGACCEEISGFCTETYQSQCFNTFHPNQSCTSITCGTFIPPGIDCWATDCGATQTSFAETPIPASFFDPGSEPFTGVIRLQGGPSPVDTVVQRMGPLQFGPLPSTATVPIEIVSLNLVSCMPITVRTNNMDVLWDVSVSLSTIQPPPGSMTVTKMDANGGTFTSEFFVQPVFTFTRVAPPNDMRVLDTGLAGVPPIHMQSPTPSPWSTNDSLATPPCQPDGFAPGFRGTCCEEVCHSSFGTAPHVHCTRSPNCPPCPVPTGACCIGLACVPGLTEVGCSADGGTWLGAGTDCFPNPCVPPVDYWLDLQGNEPVEQGGTGYQGTWFPYPNSWWNQWWPNEYSLQRQKVVKLRFWLEFTGPAPTVAFNYSAATWTNPDQPPLPADDAAVIRVPIDPPPNGSGYFEREITLPFCPAWVSVDVRAATASQNLRIQGYIEHICLAAPTGACCFTATGACQELTQAACQLQGGNWLGAGTDCFPNPCVPPLDYWLDLQGNVPVEQGGTGYEGTWFPYPNFWWNQWWPNEYDLQRQKLVKLRFWLEFNGPAPTVAFNYAAPAWVDPAVPPLPQDDDLVIRIPVEPPPSGPGYFEREIILPFCPAWVSVDVRAATPSHNLRIQGYIEHECLPPPTGACCLPNGDCIVTTQADCRCGDINGDGTTDSADLFIMALAWNSCVGDPSYNPDADLNGDGCVNGRDFQYFRLCVTVGTTYAGDGTTCDPNPCPKEACCFCDSSCQLLPPKTCIELGGLPVGGTACTANLCGYTKVNNPPDVDKPTPADPNCIPPGDNSCYLATAANMLAGAGYGTTGTTMQARAQSIYNQLKARFGCKNTGWVDTALSWWLASTHNNQPNNPYKVVTVYGNKTKTPYNRNDLPRFIGNELRRCQFVGLSISWPAAGGATGGHAFTAWGDNGSASNLTRNPKCIKTTDSDTDAGGNVQTYMYDDPNNPNPGGANNGRGHYIDYSANHPFIKHIVTLCPTDSPTDNVKTQKVVGSYRIHQRRATPATDLHYKVGTDVDILTYRTTIDWPTTVPPTIVEDTTPARNLTVDWPTFATPIPQCKWVTITTEFIVPTWNSIKYKDVHFTYPPGTEDAMQIGELPDIRFDVQTPAAPDPNAPNISGGYVVARFELWGSPRGGEPLVEFALQHEYDPDQDPEAHNFILQSLGPVRGVGASLEVRNLRFGHSYGLLEDEELWQFNEWMTVAGPIMLPIGGEIQMPVDWDGQLPYPKGEDYVDCNENDTPDELDIADGTSLDVNGNGIPDECETPTICLGDVNCDGVVTFKDIDPFVARLGCPTSNPTTCNTGCPWQAADINGDGAVTFADIDPFVGTLGTVCPAR